MADAERLFTRDEARALLPRLRELLGGLSEASEVVTDRGRVQRVRTVTGGNGGGSAARELMEGGELVARLMAAIGELGVVVRDPASGLVDFPAEIDGRPVYLCWRVDEDDVAHWHDRDAGFAGRQPL